MRYLHTMVRVKDLTQSLAFYCDQLGLIEVRRVDNEQGRFTLVFLAAPDDREQATSTQAPLIELTYNWHSDNSNGNNSENKSESYSSGRNFGHLAFCVDNIFETCQTLLDNGVTINRPPRDGHMAFIQSPDGISIELLQKGNALPACEPWQSMGNTGSW
ncbi:lactoylglutathione lyase [uncultured Shewanella sp.]|uniref:lactoylglutathione lyase n=1 Tax=uncultured Shewanella sp. TaxID=173975 RepID=UPI002615F074|nr:lactoylglutathione lyase [uncultured Shewanella sp.]